MSVPAQTTVDIATYIPVFKQTYEGGVSGLWFNKVAKVAPTDSQIGIYPGLAAVAKMANWTPGAARQKNVPLPFKLTVTNQPMESSVQFPTAAYKTDKLGIFADNVNGLARKAMFSLNWSVRDLLINAVVTPASMRSFEDLYDGTARVNFFSASHPTVFDATGASPSGTQSNLLTFSTIPSLKVASTTVAIPTAGEAAQILADVTGYMLTLTDLAGDQINGTMRKIAVICGTFQQYSAFLTAANSVNLVGAITGANGAVVSNPLGGLKDQGFYFDIILEPTIGATSGTANTIFFAREDAEVAPILVQTIGDITYTTLGPGSEYDGQFGQVLFGVRADRAFSGLNYTAICACTIAHT